MTTMMLLTTTSLFSLLLLLHLQCLIGPLVLGLLRENNGERNDTAPGQVCHAKNLHLSPASSVDINHTIDMYVSFTLDYSHCRDQSVVIHFARMKPEPPNDEISTQSKFEILQFASYQHSWNFHPYQSSFIYHGKLEKLQPSTDYWYRIYIGNETEIGNDTSSNPIPFTTPTALGQPTTLAIVGDWGQTSSSMKTMELIWKATVAATTATGLDPKSGQVWQRRSLFRSGHYRVLTRSDKMSPSPPPPPVSAILVVGDLSYANGHLPSWESWLTQMQQPLFQSTPILIAAGNHELECDGRNFQIFQAYEHYFRTPDHEPPTDWRPVPVSQRWQGCTHTSEELWSVYEGGNSYYQYRQGLAHLIVLNSYTNTSVGSPQYQWLQHVLDHKVDRTVTPWLIISFHCPLHTTFRGHNHEINPQVMGDAMEPLFVRYQVNMVFSGHQHAYVRSYAMRHGQVDPHGKGPIYWTVGTGGDSHSLGPLHQQEAWVAARDHMMFGAGQLQLINATHAHWERLLLLPLDDVSAERTDSVWVENYYVPPQTINSVASLALQEDEDEEEMTMEAMAIQ
jgi:acid phosphatase type 7